MGSMGRTGSIGAGGDKGTAVTSHPCMRSPKRRPNGARWPLLTEQSCKEWLAQLWGRSSSTLRMPH